MNMFRTTFIILVGLASLLACDATKSAQSANQPVAPTTAKAEKAFKGYGNEPSWTIEINNQGITWTTIDEAPVVYPGVPAQTNGNKTTYQTQAGKSTLKVVLTPEPCKDNMSGKRYLYEVEVQKDGAFYFGCANPL